MSESFTSDGVDQGRRYFLIGSAAVVAGVGAVGAAVPFISSWQPSAKALALGAPVRIDFSKLAPGEMLGPIPAWRGKPIFVVYRTPEALEALEPPNPKLADPQSTRLEQQPDYARNPYRSRRAEIGVYIGICTHLGCSPKYYGEVEPQPFAADWQGGFFCPCHGSLYDLAGRVYERMPAPANLEVPPYSYVTDNEIVVGLEESAA